MTTLSVPLPHHLEAFIEAMVRRGTAPNKAEVVRQALLYYAEDQAIASVLKSEQEAQEGKILRGDLRKLVKKLP
jgi:Arc/MetJ-type ribon-helix-helix transcriptional regulator